MTGADPFIEVCYLLAAVLFTLGIKGLSHPRTAVRGNLLAAVGMLIAIVVTLLDKRIVSYEVIVVQEGYIGVYRAKTKEPVRSTGWGGGIDVGPEGGHAGGYLVAAAQ